MSDEAAYLTPLQRGERLLAVRLVKLERLLEHDEAWWPDYLETFRAFCTARQIMAGHVTAPITKAELRRRFAK